MRPPRLDGVLGGHSHFDQLRGGPFAQGKLLGAQLLDEQSRFGIALRLAALLVLAAGQPDFPARQQCQHQQQDSGLFHAWFPREIACCCILGTRRGVRPATGQGCHRHTAVTGAAVPEAAVFGVRVTCHRFLSFFHFCLSRRSPSMGKEKEKRKRRQVVRTPKWVATADRLRTTPPPGSQAVRWGSRRRRPAGTGEPCRRRLRCGSPAAAAAGSRSRGLPIRSA